MARTALAAALTERHRLAQLQLRSHVVRDFSKLWPLWNPNDPKSFQSLVDAASTLVRVYQPISATVAAGYFTAFRTAETVDGAAAPQVAALPANAMIAASLYATGETATRKALAGGHAPEDAMQTAFVRTTGALTRHVLNGGRDTIVDSVAADKHALGWSRVTDGNPCAFCLVLASRGPVYKTEQSAGFEAHDHCGCAAEPFYRDADWAPGARDFLKTYDAAQQWGVENGLLQPGENSSGSRINAVRRYLAQQ